MSLFYNFEICLNKKNKGIPTFLPTRATECSAGYDLYSPVDVSIPSNTVKVIWTDVKINMRSSDENSIPYLKIVPRSSMGIKHSIMLANTTGIIDADYYNNSDNEGNIGIALYNYGTKEYNVKAKDRIAQAICDVAYKAVVDTVLSKARSGGIGSSGT